MGLRMESVGPGSAVMAYCDYCGKRIDDCTMANVAYDPDDESGSFELVHKECTWSYDERDHRRGVYKGMDEMDQWLVYLEGNVGFTEQVRRKARGTVRALVSVGMAFGKVR